MFLQSYLCCNSLLRFGHGAEQSTCSDGLHVHGLPCAASPCLAPCRGSGAGATGLPPPSVSCRLRLQAAGSRLRHTGPTCSVAPLQVAARSQGAETRAQAAQAPGLSPCELRHLSTPAGLGEGRRSPSPHAPRCPRQGLPGWVWAVGQPGGARITHTSPQAPSVHAAPSPGGLHHGVLPAPSLLPIRGAPARTEEPRFSTSGRKTAMAKDMGTTGTIPTPAPRRFHQRCKLAGSNYSSWNQVLLQQPQTRAGTSTPARPRCRREGRAQAAPLQPRLPAGELPSRSAGPRPAARFQKASHAIKAAPTHCLRPDAIPGDV